MKRVVITITEFAKLQGVSRDTIYKWMDKDKLPKGSYVKRFAGRNFISTIINESETV